MKLNIGDRVTFVDEFRKDHNALVTTVFPGMSGAADGCNLVFVSGDESRGDSYGRQIERKTSVPHVSGNPAAAMCWKEAA